MLAFSQLLSYTSAIGSRRGDGKPGAFSRGTTTSPTLLISGQFPEKAVPQAEVRTVYISRIVIRNFRNFAHLDIALQPGTTCIVGENNTGKTNLLHAIRLVIDNDLSSQSRRLIEHDIHSTVNIRTPNQVLISVEFRDYKSNINEKALVGTWEVADDLARITYRFLPTPKTQQELEAEEISPQDLILEEHFHWQITGGGEKDPATVDWNEPLGRTVRFAHLQRFHVEHMKALRDVRHDLHNSYVSPLGRLLDASAIPETEKHNLVTIMRTANSSVSQQPTIKQAGKDIHDSFDKTAGEAFRLAVRLGMADPSFGSIARSLTVLLSCPALTDFQADRNGLGLNNILYLSMLLEYFQKRISNNNTAGQLLLLEEPEAHLHPQLQRVLYATLAAKPFQTILTTHSTHISSHAPIESFVVLTNTNNVSTSSCVPEKAAALSATEAADLNRFLDATRSTLLFARKVILVEGPAELFLIPALVKKVLDVDLDRLGITVIPIHGVHFEVYAKLFGKKKIPKKCAIITDADLKPSDAAKAGGEEGELWKREDLIKWENSCVRVFSCKTTFEKALAIRGMLPVLWRATSDLKAPRIMQTLRNAYNDLEDTTDPESVKVIRGKVQSAVLRTAKRFGKARFAQVASKHIGHAEAMPKYISRAIRWITKP